MLEKIKNLVAGTLSRRTGNNNQSETGEEQLVALFHNRNELKRQHEQTLRELSQAREELQFLKEASEGKLERLEELERMLADHEKGQGAIIFYRLHALWHICKVELEKMSRELKTRVEEKEKAELLKNFKEKQASEVRALGEKFQQIQGVHKELIMQKEVVEKKLLTLQKIWHFFKRRAIQAELTTIEADIDPVNDKLKTTEAELNKAKAKEPPEYEGLSVGARRDVNLRVIAYAQYFYVHFMENDLSVMAKSTQEKMPHETNFGKPQECLSLEKPIRDSVAKLKADTDKGKKIQRRYEHISKQTSFKGNSDTVPEMDTLNKLALSIGGTASDMTSVVT
ncbi:MAG: hypothetical protein MJA83_00580, partial [Gammaproteobacteria bacterium]|nr:hypothetical protein [Gammaproteobacteria bacterium]